MLKKCFKCGELKERTKFYRHPKMKDGLLGKCKECTKTDSRKNYSSNTEKYKKYEASRLDDPKRREARRLRAKYLRDNFPEIVKSYHAKYDLIKKKASVSVNRAIRSGKLVKGPCLICGNPESEGHHEDYTKPLEVKWLCKKHHGMVHRKAYIPEVHDFVKRCVDTM